MEYTMKLIGTVVPSDVRRAIHEYYTDVSRAIDVETGYSFAQVKILRLQKKVKRLKEELKKLSNK